MQITRHADRIFTTALTLNRSRGLRYAVYAGGREIFILNYDNTVLLRFLLRTVEPPFSESFSFWADDYNGKDITIENGFIVFTIEKCNFIRRKISKTAEYSFDEVKTNFQKFYPLRKSNTETLFLHKEILHLLDSSLAHIKLSGNKGGSIKMNQYNIYSGGVIEIENTELNHCPLKKDFKSLGIKTDVFFALFAFQDILKFEFPAHKEYFIVHGRGKGHQMTGIISGCVYDESIKIKEVKP